MRGERRTPPTTKGVTDAIGARVGADLRATNVEGDRS